MLQLPLLLVELAQVYLSLVLGGNDDPARLGPLVCQLRLRDLHLLLPSCATLGEDLRLDLVVDFVVVLELVHHDHWLLLANVLRLSLSTPRLFAEALGGETWMFNVCQL